MFEYPGKYYDIIRERHRILSQETEFIKRVLSPKSTVLDLGCGTGTNLLDLAKHGFSGVGVDSSDCFIDYARSKARDSHASLTFQNENMGHFLSKDKFDAVLCLFSSVFHLPYDDLPQFFGNVRAQLKPGGVFVLECGHLLQFVEHFQPTMNYHYSKDGITITRIINHRIKAVEGTWNHEETLIVDDNGALKMYHERYTQQILKTREVELMIKAAGFQHCDFSHDFLQGTAFGTHPQMESRMIFCAR